MAVRLLSNQNVNGDIDVNHSQNAITYVAVTNTDTGVAANSRVQVVGESSQLDLIATSAGYTGVTGWADAGIITTDSGASGGLKLNSQAGGIQLQIGTTSHFYLATTGNVGINDAGAAATSLSVKDTQDTAFTSGISVIRSANSDVGYINMVGGAFNLNSTKNTKLRVSDVTKLEVKSNGINVIGKTETDTLLSTGAAQFDTTAQIGSDTTATPELLTVQAYSHNEAFSGKSSATNYIWFLRNENDSGRFQLFNSSGAETIEFTGADGAATFAGDVALTGGSLSITGDGSNAATLTESGAGILTIAAVDDLILDSGSDISLDAGGNDIRLKVNGIEYAKFKDDSDDLAMFSSIQDKDILFKGNDGGSTITALTLDMSNGGSATFRDDIDLGGKLTQTGTGENRFYGNVEFDKNVWQDISTNGGYIMRPNGADYVTTTGAVTGAIEIRIPTGGTGKDDMIKFVVDIYDYATQESITVFIGGYIYQAIGGTTWTNVSAQIIATDSSKNYKVRFGDNGSVHCVWIGETDSTWSYPQILVRDFYGGFATTVEDYLATWDITYVTSFTTVSNTLTNNFPMSHGGTDDAFWSASGANIYNDNSGNVGIGITSPTSRIDVREDANNVYTGYFYNSSTAANAHGINVQTATTNAGAYAFRVNSASNANALVVMGNARVGIGTSTPDMPLDVAGNIRSRVASNVAGGFYIGEGHTAEAFGLLSQGANGYFKIRDEYHSADRFYIENDGNVGIGTTSPQDKLEIKAGYLRMYDASSNVNAGYPIRWTSDNGGTNVTFAEISGLTTSAGNRTGALYFSTSNAGAPTEKMRITSAGNVGIGTTSPTSKLDISDAVDRVMNSSGEGQFEITGNGYTFGIAMGATTTALYHNSGLRNLSFGTNETERLTITGAGNVGIGTTSPNKALTVYGSNDNGIWIDSQGGQYTSLAFGHNGTEKANIAWDNTNGYTNISTYGSGHLAMSTGGSINAFLNSSGNFGIGTTAPTSISVNTNSLTVGSSRNDLSGAIVYQSNGTIKAQSYWDSTGWLTYVNSGTARWYTNATLNMELNTSGTLTVKADLVAYGSPSDKRLKENIKPIESALDKVEKLQGVTFDWKESDSILNIKEDIGFIAQDVQKVIPELVRENKDGMLSMRHQGIAPILLEAIKELKAEIEELKKNK
jgi:hypothetical protein